MGQLHFVGRWQRESQRLHEQPNISGILANEFLEDYGRGRKSPCHRFGLRTPPLIRGNEIPLPSRRTCGRAFRKGGILCISFIMCCWGLIRIDVHISRIDLSHHFLLVDSSPGLMQLRSFPGFLCRLILLDN